MKKLNFTTPMTKLGVYATLKEETEIDSIHFMFPFKRDNDKTYRGIVEKDRFSIIRFKRYSNQTMTPIFSGKISESEKKTSVSISITLHKHDTIAAFVFFGITALILVLLCVFGCSELIDYLSAIFSILAYDLLIFLLFFTGFKLSAKRTLSKLKKLLQLEEI